MCVFSSTFNPFFHWSIEEDHDTLSIFWECVVISLIGESLDNGNNITGARVIDKSNISNNQINYRVEIWFRNWEDEAFKASLLAETEKLLQLCGCTSAKTSIETNDYSRWMTKESKWNENVFWKGTSRKQESENENENEKEND